MKLFLALVPLLFAFPASGQRHIQGPECEGAIHGVVLGQDSKPVSELDVTLYPLGVDLGVILPHMKTDQRGEYLFEQLCSGRYNVFITDTEAGYPNSSPYMNQFLYGGRIPEVKITDTHSHAELPVNLSPKPAKLQVRLTNSKTKTKIEEADIKLKVNRKRSVILHCDDSSPCDSKPFFLFPPDQDVLIHVTANGFHKWKEGARRGKTIRVPSGELLTIDVVLDPIGN